MTISAWETINVKVLCKPSTLTQACGISVVRGGGVGRETGWAELLPHTWLHAGPPGLGRLKKEDEEGMLRALQRGDM
jgi:hypothetical protein